MAFSFSALLPKLSLRRREKRREKMCKKILFFDIIPASIFNVFVFRLNVFFFVTGI